MFAALNSFLVGQLIPAGQQAYTTAGTYSWTCPDGVTSVSVVCVGGGSGGGGYASGAPSGGALGYKNAIAVTPGLTYTIVVGSGGIGGDPFSSGNVGEDSTFSLNGTGIVGAQGGIINSVGSGGPLYATPLYGSSGGRGQASGCSWSSGGGGAGGYSGDGGDPCPSGNPYAPTGGSGGGGGAGYGSSATNNVTSAGGGVGILGQGSSGAAGAPTGATIPSSGGAVWGGGGGGSGGGNGGNGGAYGAGSWTISSIGGNYGGAGGCIWHYNNGMYISGSHNGAGGAVRIIWAGTTGITRAFPSTNTGDL